MYGLYCYFVGTALLMAFMVCIFSGQVSAACVALGFSLFCFSAVEDA